MATILIAYSTTDGHTLKICQRLQQVIEQRGHQVTLLRIDDEPDVDLKRFDKIVLGASIRYGKHKPLVYRFIERYADDLRSRPSAFFSVNVVARKPGKDRPATNPYIRKFLQLSAWRPRELEVFAGKIDYQKYRLADRLIIRLIMWMTHGPTDPKTVAEFTNWGRVEDFGELVCTM